jgi:hypothetical protein
VGGYRMVTISAVFGLIITTNRPFYTITSRPFYFYTCTWVQQAASFSVQTKLFFTLAYRPYHRSQGSQEPHSNKIHTYIHHATLH